ncbi:MAG: YHS domain-containing protein [Candidatus Aminicenantes bacterium]|nr:YHS domain-containing protein [Candidatus Aminicenantes bacterium]
MSGLFRIILYALVAYFIYIIVKSYQSLKQSKKGRRRPSSKPSIMVKDPACNTYLPKEDALKETYKGKDYFFCSAECRDRFYETKKKKG